MISKHAEKLKAIRMRKDGKTYSEILKEVKVAKSSLSLWFKEVELSKPQKQAITEKKLAAAWRGGQVKKQRRIALTKEIYGNAEKEIGKISDRELWLIGTVLYWAEGSKEKSYRPGSGLDFTNSDPFMSKLYYSWLLNICKVEKSEIFFEIYIHKNYLDRINGVKEYWSKVINVPVSKLRRVYFKKHNLKTNRKNTGNMYNGNLRIRVKASSTLLRKITGWTQGIYKNY